MQEGNARLNAITTIGQQTLVFTQGRGQAGDEVGDEITDNREYYDEQPFDRLAYICIYPGFKGYPWMYRVVQHVGIIAAYMCSMWCLTSIKFQLAMMILVAEFCATTHKTTCFLGRSFVVSRVLKFKNAKKETSMKLSYIQ